MTSSLPNGNQSNRTDQKGDSFVHTTGMFNNLYVKLRESQEEFYEKGENGWKILIHDVRDSPVIDSQFDYKFLLQSINFIIGFLISNPVRTHGSTLDNGWGKDIRIYLREVTQSRNAGLTRSRRLKKRLFFVRSYLPLTPFRNVTRREMRLPTKPSFVSLFN